MALSRINELIPKKPFPPFGFSYHNSSDVKAEEYISPPRPLPQKICIRLEGFCGWMPR